MSTDRAKRNLSINNTVFINTFDNTLQIDYIDTTQGDKGIKIETLDNGNILIWHCCVFKPYFDNNGVLIQRETKWCVLLQQVRMNIIDKQCTLNKDDWTKLGYNVNQQLLLAIWKGLSEKERLNFDINNYIFITPICYARKQDCTKPNYDKYCAVGNASIDENILFNLKSPLVFNKHTLCKGNIAPPLQTPSGKYDSNITRTSIQVR